MTQPRRILPGSTYLVTRRCTQRQFLLVPRGPTPNLFGYCLAVASERLGVRVHGYAVLSNHWHAVVTDPEGRVSDFLQLLHSLVGRALNAQFGRWENLWSSQRASIVRLTDADDVLAKLVYTLTNPVAAGLVKSHVDWPGLCSKPTSHLGPGQSFARPRKFFRDEGPLPEVAVLSVTQPPQHAHLDPQAFADLLGRRVAEREEALREAAGKSGRTFLGAREVLRQKRTARPASSEPRRGPDPEVAALHTPSRLAELVALVTFRAAYRRALRAFRAGDRDVVFPAGTFAMLRRFAVRCNVSPVVVLSPSGLPPPDVMAAAA